MCTSLKARILLIVCSMLLCSTCRLMNCIANIDPNQKKQDVQLVHENKPSHQKNSTSSTYGYGALLRGSTKFTKLFEKIKTSSYHHNSLSTFRAILLWPRTSKHIISQTFTKK